MDSGVKYSKRANIVVIIVNSPVDRFSSLFKEINPISDERILSPSGDNFIGAHAGFSTIENHQQTETRRRTINLRSISCNLGKCAGSSGNGNEARREISVAAFVAISGSERCLENG